AHRPRGRRGLGAADPLRRRRRLRRPRRARARAGAGRPGGRLHQRGARAAPLPPGVRGLEPVAAQAQETLAVDPATAVVPPPRSLLLDRTLFASLAVLAGVALLGVIGSWLSPHDPLAANLLDSLEAPSRAHPMGTDSLGRDVFARFCRGAEISMAI